MSKVPQDELLELARKSALADTRMAQALEESAAHQKRIADLLERMSKFVLATSVEDVQDLVDDLS